MAEFQKGYFQKTRGLYNPVSTEPYKVSRSKIDLFVECPRCFYLDQRLGLGRPRSFPFTLNNAVDTLLKKEFDAFREAGTTHPLMKQYGIDAVPLKHPALEEWRDAMRRGISFYYEPAQLIVRGGIDDVWIDKNGSLIIVDYKATSKDTEVNLDAEWQGGYKRQMEVYQWLFRQNGFTVNDIGYFVYVNGKTDVPSFDAKLEFDMSILPYSGNTDWIPTTLETMVKCLRDSRIPKKAQTCEYCGYMDGIINTLRNIQLPATNKIVDQQNNNPVGNTTEVVRKKKKDEQATNPLF